MVEIPATVTRVDIIAGDVHEFWADEWDVSVQDGGRTVKLFAKGSGEQPERERDRALDADMAADLLKVLERYGG